MERGVAAGATGWLFGNESDQVGLSLASAQQGDTYRRNVALAGVRSTRSETTRELSYLRRLKKWLTLEPDLQVVMHPNADAASHAALVLQMRSEIAF